MSDFYIILNDKTGETRSINDIEQLRCELNSVLQKYDFRVNTIVDRYEVRKIINGEDKILNKMRKFVEQNLKKL